MLLYFTDHYSIHKAPKKHSPDGVTFIVYKVATNQQVVLKKEAGMHFYKELNKQCERLVDDDKFEEMVDAMCAKFFATIH